MRFISELCKFQTSIICQHDYAFKVRANFNKTNVMTVFTRSSVIQQF